VSAVDLDFPLDRFPRLRAVFTLRLHLYRKDFFRECQINTVIAGDVLSHFAQHLGPWEKP